MTRLSNAQLFAIAVGIWGTTWYAIVHQIGSVAPEFAVAMRFTLAALVVLAIAVLRRESLRMSRAQHGVLAAQGLTMYTAAYLCVYHAERHVPSGLVAVGYSLSPLIAGVAARALWRTPISRRFVAGGLLGVAGVAALFAPELSAARSGGAAGLGLGFTMGAVALSAVGSLVASRNAGRGLAFWPALGLALAWGAAATWLVVAATGTAPALSHWPRTPGWWLSLTYLAVAGTAIAFAAYLTLQQRLGPGPASTVGVMTPVLALAVSTALEGYRPGAWAAFGALLTILGNVLMLRR